MALDVENRQSFRKLDWLAADWELLVDGVVARHGRLRVPSIEPLGRQPPWHCRARFRLVTTTFASPCGGRRSAMSGGHRPAISWRGTRSRCGEGGRPGRATEGGPPDTALTEAVRPNLWRAATDNDGFKLMPELAQRLRVGGQALRRWQQTGVDRLPADQLVAHHVEITDDAQGRTYRHVFEVPESLADLPRVGVMFSVASRASQGCGGSDAARTRTTPTATGRR